MARTTRAMFRTSHRRIALRRNDGDGDHVGDACDPHPQTAARPDRVLQPVHLATARDSGRVIGHIRTYAIVNDSRDVDANHKDMLHGPRDRGSARRHGGRRARTSTAGASAMRCSDRALTYHRRPARSTVRYRLLDDDARRASDTLGRAHLARASSARDDASSRAREPARDAGSSVETGDGGCRCETPGCCGRRPAYDVRVGYRRRSRRVRLAINGRYDYFVQIHTD